MKAFDLIPIQRVENNNENEKLELKKFHSHESFWFNTNTQSRKQEWNDTLVHSFSFGKTYAVPTQ